MPQAFMSPSYLQQYPQHTAYGQLMQQGINPYVDRLAQLQAQQQNLQVAQMPVANQPFPALGKIVESEDIVKSTDIPMDGNMYYFPQADGSAVYGKQWLANGTTRITAFKPSLEDEVVNPSENDLKSLYEANKGLLDGIAGKLDALQEKIDKMTKPTRVKKESAEDE